MKKATLIITYKNGFQSQHTFEGLDAVRHSFDARVEIAMYDNNNHKLIKSLNTIIEKA